MNKGMKLLLAVLLGAYVISPVDLISGCPIDDVILILLTVVSSRRIGKNDAVAKIEGKDAT